MATWRRYLGPLALLAAVALAMPVASADQPARSPDLIVQAQKVGSSRPLAEIARMYRDAVERGEIPATLPGQEVNPLNSSFIPPRAGAAPEPAEQVDTVVQRGFGVDAMPAPTVNIDGISSDDNQAVLGGRLMPPDTEGDVGPNHYVMWINLLIEVYDKNGNSLAGPFPGNDLWDGFGGTCETSNNGDPIVLYDQFNDRWMMSQFTGDNHQCIAVSKTGDPTGEFWLYDFIPNASYFPDYPKFGIWTDGLYYTANAFSPYSGVLAGVYEWDKMLDGDPALQIMFLLPWSDLDNFFYSFLPADIEGMTPPPAGTPAIFAGMVDDAYGASAPFDNDCIQLWQMDTDWTTPANTTVTLLDVVNVASFDSAVCGLFNSSRNCIRQPGTSEGLDALSNRLMFRLNYRNFGGHQALTASHTVDTNGSDLAGVRWYELRAPGGGTDWDVYQQGSFAPDSDSRFMGDVNMDGSGNMLIGYTVSSSATFPSARVAGRLAGDPLGTMGQGELELVAGGGSQTGGAYRWGDYSTVSVDPVDDCTFWVAQEYVKDGGSFEWETRIAALKFPGCGGPSGTIEGTVESAATMLPIEGAVVDFGGLYSTLTDAAGFYSMALPVGTYDLTVTKFGFAQGEATGVEVLEGETTTQDFQLLPVGAAEFDGYVTDAGHGWPLYAKVEISLGGLAPIATVFTNPFNGYYSVELPQGSVYDFLVTPLYPGYAPDTGAALLPPGGMAVNFTLSPTGDCTAPGYTMGAPLLYEDFEGSFPPAGWAVVDNVSSGNNWNTNVYFGKPNNTLNGGGEGQSAAADSDATCSSVPWNAELRSLPIDLPASPSKTISFATNFQDYAGDGEAWFEISTDGGSSWTTLWYGTNDDPGGTTGGGLNRSFDLAAYAGETVIFKWRYDDGGGTCAWWWQIDTVFLPGVCVPIPGALVGGFVTDANTAMAINGATVQSSTGAMGMSVPTPDDPNLPDGWWWLFEELPGLGPSTRTFTASAPGYAAREYEINVVPEAMNQVGFELEAGWLEVVPLTFDSRLYSGETAIELLDLINHGGLDANVMLMTLPVVLTWDKSSPVKDTGNLPGNHDPTSIERAPVVGAPVAAPSPEALALAGVPAHAIDLIGNNLVEWPDVTVPGTWNITSGGMTENFYAGDFLLGDLSTLYALDNAALNLVAIDTATGAKTVIGSAAPGGGESWTGMTGAVNGTLYASGTTCSASTLYTVDPGTGAVTAVGPITNGPCIIDIAINAAGEMYGVDIIGDVLVQIDPATGAGTVVGSLGLAANYAQGMDFDEVSGTLYWAAYGASGELRTIDTTTGASTLIGPFPGGTEVDSFAIATSVGVSLPWLTLTPDAGVVPADEGELPVDGEFIADGAPHYGLHKAMITVIQDTPYPVDDVDVYFTKAFWDIPAGYWADAYIHALAGIRVTFGCGFGNFCPDDEILRMHMAVFMVRMMYGADYRPPTAVGIFVDVPIEDYETIADYIEQIYNDGVAAGCMVDGDDIYYCPDRVMNRAEMAVLICKARGWDPLTPPYDDMFGDVPEDHWAAGYIYRMRDEGVTAGCGGGLFCDEDPVSRAQIAVFLVKAWNVEYFVH